MRVYYRNLPHWRQPGATYFVTFRQADSIPKAIIAEWRDTRDRWFRAHRIDPRWLVSNPERLTTEFEKIAHGVRMAFEREQARLLHDELDRSHGSCVLRHSHLQTELTKSLFHFHEDRLAVGDWVIMPNHVHAIVQPFGDSELETIVGSIKHWTLRLIVEWLRTQPLSFRLRGPVIRVRGFGSKSRTTESFAMRKSCFGSDNTSVRMRGKQTFPTVSFVTTLQAGLTHSRRVPCRSMGFQPVPVSLGRR